MAATAAATKAAKATKNGSATDSLSDLRLLSDERLIANAVNCQKVIEDAEAEYNRVLAVLEERFPGEKATEHIITEFGVAERKVTSAWIVKPGKEAALREALGKMYSEWIEERESVTVVRDRVPELAAKLGAKWHDYFHFATDLKVTPRLQNAIKAGDDKLAKSASRFIDVVQKTTVKVKPVERDKK